MPVDLTDDDRGKEVVTGSERIGVITDVQSGEAAVDPEWSNVDDDLADALDWDPDGDAQTVDASDITAVQNDQAHIRDDLV